MARAPYMPDECSSSKPRYATGELAKAAAITAMKRNPRVELSYYSCRLCGGYHLTKSVGGANPKLR